MANKKDYTKGKYKKYRFLIRKKEDADILNDIKLATDNGYTKIEWLRKLFDDAGLNKRG